MGSLDWPLYINKVRVPYYNKKVCRPLFVCVLWHIPHAKVQKNSQTAKRFAKYLF